MSTFLQLCQDVARESGTISGTNPTTVVSQTGRELKVVEWTAEAWRLIQNLYPNWRWMQGEFSDTTTAATERYTAASWSLTDLRDWKRDNPITLYHPHSIYLTATGVSDMRTLREISWQQWRTQYGRGSQTNNYPIEYAISPLGEFCPGPIPDDTYTIEGEYDKSAIIMALDADTPACPAQFHSIILWRALMLLGEFDGGDALKETRDPASTKYDGMLRTLMRDQLPVMSLGGEPVA